MNKNLNAPKKLPIVTATMIAAVAVILTLNYVFATPLTTPGFNWAGGRGSAANLTGVLNAIGADDVVCATAGTAAVVQQFDNFGLTLHPSAVIHGVRVSILGSISAGSDTWSVYLRKNESGTKSSTLTGSVTSNAACGSTQQTITFGNLTGTFGQSWTASELDDDGFTIGISLPAIGAGTRRINWVKVEVNYSLPTTTTTITSTFNTTVTYNTTVTSTFNTTVTYNTTVTSTVNVTSTFNTTVTYNTTATTYITNTTTITAAICSGLCVNMGQVKILPLMNGASSSYDSSVFLLFMSGAVPIILMMVALLIGRKKRGAEDEDTGDSGGQMT